VNDVCGKFPAVFGWDAGGIGFKSNIDSVSFTNMKNWIVTAFEKGGINTLSWHLDNPVTGEGTWDVTPAVHAIIPGGEIHEQYRKLLDKLALFLQALKTEDGTYIPVIFRPFHEHTGSWFWWGLDNCTREEFIALFRFTVEYLRDEKGLHHLLYAYSPGSFDSEDEYLERFPGTDYIDLLGYDDYHSFSTLENIPEGLATLGTLVKLGREMNKPVAYTETGLESIPIADWWTNYMLEPIKSDPEARKITYILFWRNANTKHHYAPYPGHLSADNFIRYEQDEFTWFLEDLPDMYTLNE
jgi:mannan endo-1,4-beta-mannosidase